MRGKRLLLQVDVQVETSLLPHGQTTAQTTRAHVTVPLSRNSNRIESNPDFKFLLTFSCDHSGHRTCNSLESSVSWLVYELYAFVELYITECPKHARIWLSIPTGSLVNSNARAATGITCTFSRRMVFTQCCPVLHKVNCVRTVLSLWLRAQ